MVELKSSLLWYERSEVQTPHGPRQQGISRRLVKLEAALYLPTARWAQIGFWITLTRLMWLTHLSRMNFPISIGRTSLFQILGMLDGIFSFLFKFY